MSNFPATLAAVAARGARCHNCGHWTFRPAKLPQSGGPPPKEFCRNCTGLSGGTAVVTITGRRSAALRLRQRDGGRS